MKTTRSFLLFFLSLFSACVLAGNLNGGFNTNDYPKVSFVWHEHNPHVYEASSFKLLENNKDVRFDFEEVSLQHPEEENAYVVLWEDMAAYNEYHHFYEFTKQVLQSFFSNAPKSEDDYFYLAVYNRTRTDENTLRPLVERFTNQQSDLLQAVNNYRRSIETFSQFPSQSDAFPALNEALDMLNMRENKGAKAIFIITVGHALENSATNSVVAVREKSKELHIPIYVIQYAAPYGQAQKFWDLATSTYGLSLSVNSAKMQENVDASLMALNEMYRKAETRYYGRDYQFTYESSMVRGGAAATLTISVNGVDSQVQMMPPSHNILSWIKAHLILSIICIVLFIVLLVVGIVLFQKHKASQARQMEALRQKQQQAVQQANAAQQALENYKQETKQQEIARQNEDLQKQLASIMRAKNLYPHLYISENGKNSMYEIGKPTITIGRKSDNDLVLSNNAVSRLHAQIVFNGVDFTLEDMQSTNGVFVNGQVVSSMRSLKDQDMINIGQAIITFKI